MRNKGTGAYEIAVIGGGASGLFAAAAAAEEARRNGLPAHVTVYEGNARVGKKILVTGNGRCNLTNEKMGAAYYRGATELFEAVYARFDRAATLAFFEDAGLFTRADFAGRVYPMSNQAASVLDALRGVCAERGVREEVSSKISS
ncbi:MAG: NAD(P)/FAD-dependent oxidoreductase, partial [Clostridia bacterium]|nr:NAD(P)/FAD-dependent oxidoreductase [Clostridia bacterium]